MVQGVGLSGVGWDEGGVVWLERSDWKGVSRKGMTLNVTQPCKRMQDVPRRRTHQPGGLPLRAVWYRCTTKKRTWNCMSDIVWQGSEYILCYWILTCNCVTVGCYQLVGMMTSRPMIWKVVTKEKIRIASNMNCATLRDRATRSAEGRIRVRVGIKVRVG